MKNYMIKSALAGSLLLFGSAAVGEDVPPPRLAECITQFEEDTDLGIKLCQAQRARAVLVPGTSSCASSWRLMAGHATCNKSDSASVAAWDDVGFSPSSSSLSGPVSLGTMAAFYGGRRAGDGGRFEVGTQDDGSLEVMDEQADDNDLCVFQPGWNNCLKQGRYTQVNWPPNDYVRHDHAYTLQLDGLLVEQTVHEKNCGATHCSPGGTGCFCTRYEYPPPTKTRFLHLWQ